jgi:hypothetical protein
MGLFNIFRKNNSGEKRRNNPVRASQDIQSIKWSGGATELSRAEIVCLITNLQDAKVNLNLEGFKYVQFVFAKFQQDNLLRMMTIIQYIEECNLIIEEYEKKVPYWLIDGNISENISEAKKAKIWELYNSGISAAEALKFL